MGRPVLVEMLMNNTDSAERCLGSHANCILFVVCHSFGDGFLAFPRLFKLSVQLFSANLSINGSLASLTADSFIAVCSLHLSPIF